jgi:predicted small lipoprotein YifL
MRTRTLIPVLVVLGAAIALAGCGQKGNLYLPNQKKKIPAATPAPAPPPAESQPPSSGAH